MSHISNVRRELFLIVGRNLSTAEWWTERIQPWVHYVPVQIDYSDLYDALSFVSTSPPCASLIDGSPSARLSVLTATQFRGNLSGLGGEDALGREIGEAGRQWSLTHSRKEDMTAYVFRLYLEWRRLLAVDRASMDFLHDPALERAYA